MPDEDVKALVNELCVLRRNFMDVAPGGVETICEIDNTKVHAEMLCLAPLLLQLGQNISAVAKWKDSGPADKRDTEILNSVTRFLGTWSSVYAAADACAAVRSKMPRKDELAHRINSLLKQAEAHIITFAGVAVDVVHRHVRALAAALSTVINNNNESGLAKFPQVVHDFGEDVSEAQIETVMAFVNHADTERLYFIFKDHDSFIEATSQHTDKMRDLSLALLSQESVSQVQGLRDLLEKPFRSVENTVKAAGLLLGNLTAMQALFRGLNPGETRAALCKRTKRRLQQPLKHPYVVCDAKLYIALDRAGDA